MKQLTHYDIQNESVKFPITIVCDALRTPENIGMCFRISESFGVSKIYLHESSPDSNNRIVKKTARNTLHQIPYESYTNFETLITTLRQDGNAIIGIEITDKSINLKDYDFGVHKKIVLILGSERNGINNVGMTDKTVSIPMYGQNSSMNVIHSLSIALYEATNQLLKIKI